MEGWARDVDAARTTFVDEPARMPAGSAPVSAVVYESWRRSRAHGLMPDAVRPAPCGELELDTVLTRVVAAAVEARSAVLGQSSCALTLTDTHGRLLCRWVHDRSFARRLDALDVVPGFSVAESTVGTTSAITLLTGEPVLVRGPEHFSEGFVDVSCAGAPIVDPVSGRSLGSLDLTCALSHTSPLVLAWVVEIVRAVEDALRDRASRRERVMLEAHLARQRSSPDPVVTLDAATMISSAAAARVLGGVEHARLWEHALAALDDRGPAGGRLARDDGSELTIMTRAVRDGAEVIGAVLGLVGSSAAAPTTTRRPLTRLEQAEADTIMAALRDARGNKRRAARSLGIARSTLYRKARAFGLDLSTATAEVSRNATAPADGELTW